MHVVALAWVIRKKVVLLQRLVFSDIRQCWMESEWCSDVQLCMIASQYTFLFHYHLSCLMMLFRCKTLKISSQIPDAILSDTRLIQGISALILETPVIYDVSVVSFICSWLVETFYWLMFVCIPHLLINDLILSWVTLTVVMELSFNKYWELVWYASCQSSWNLFWSSTCSSQTLFNSSTKWIIILGIRQYTPTISVLFRVSTK